MINTVTINIKDMQKAILTETPVMPLSEVLELLENELKDMDVEDDFTDGFKSGFSLAHHLIKQKYGVSE